MNRDVRVVCRPETASGFRMAGLPVHVAADPDEARQVVADLRAEGRAGLLLIEDQLHTTGRDRGLPLVVPFPGPSRGGEAADQHVIELLRRAIGYRVRLR